MSKKYLDYGGLQKVTTWIKNTFLQEDDVPVKQIKRNGTIIQPQAKVVNISVPVKTSDLANDSNFVTENEVNQKISQLNNLEIRTVSELPPTGEPQVMYLVPKDGGSGDDIKDEYIWQDNRFEHIGTTEAVVEVESISDGEIDALLA